jgi:hypothetical protein
VADLVTGGMMGRSVPHSKVDSPGSFREIRTMSRLATLPLLETGALVPCPQPLPRPVEGWINRPKPQATEEVSHSNSCESAVSSHAGSTISLDALRATSYARFTLGIARS